MLGVSPKKTEAVDLSKPLASFIQANYSKDELTKVSGTLEAINAARQKMHSSLLKEADFAGALDAHKVYLGLITTTAQRFPFGRLQGSSFFRRKVTSIMVPFIWYDSFRQQKKALEYDSNFERASLIYNIGALNSLMAIREDRSSVEGLKRACKYFQVASGVYTYLSTHPELECVMTVDTTGLCYRLLSHLMLAQAQACFFEQAIKSKMSAGLVAKLARGTSSLFMHAYSCAERNPLKDWLEKTSYRWPFHLMYQHRCFLAAAHYWQSKAELEADQYGNEIAFLQQGAAIAADAKKFEAELIQGLIDSRARLAEMINARLAVAQKENESIYHYNVPAASALKEIEQKFVVTALAFDPAADTPKDSGAPFSNLVPMRVHEASAQYMQTMNSICSQMTRECQEATDYAKMHLASLGLPAALEAIEPDSGFPPSVWARVNEVQLKGGLRALQELQSQVRELGAECAAGLSEVREWLNSESTDDRDMRQQFGRKWNRVPSAQISASFVKDAESIDRYLKTAGASDRDITRELSASEEMLRSLEASQSELESRLPKQGPSEAKSASSERLRGLLDQLSTLIDRRTIAMKKLESQVSQENIVSALMAVPDTVPPEQIFAEERKKFEPLRNDVASALDEQKTLLEKVTGANEDFVKTKSSGQAASAREKVLQDLNVAVDKHAKLMANLNEGIKFYTDIQKDYLAPLKQTVADFMLAREAEKKMLLEQLQAESAKASSIPSRPPVSAYATPAPAPAPAPQQQYAPAPESYSFNDFQQGSGVAPAPAPQGYGGPYGGPQGYSQPAPGPAYGSQAYAPPGPAYGSAPQNPAYGAPAPNPSYGAPAPQSNAYATIMAPPASSYGSAYPSNPNLNAGFGGDHSYPVPSRGGVQPIQAPSYASSPRGSPSQPSAASKAGEWSCPSCTFINASRAMVCFMCGTDNPHPTPAGSVPAQAQPQLPAQPAKGGWRSFW